MHACMLRDLDLKPAKHEEVAIFEENQRIPNVCRIMELRSSAMIRQGRKLWKAQTKLFIFSQPSAYYIKINKRKGDRTMTLGEAKVGSTVVVTKIEGDGAYKRRIMDMGITKGSEIYIRKVAPLGDPVEITVRGYELSVRKNDAQCVQVK